MKITPAQYFEIEDFFAKTCRLVETEFIEEMTDHFMDAIEAKMAESISFHQALDSTIEDFGGLGVIQKMEWQYRKGFIQKQFGILLTIWKSQFSRQKVRRSALIVGSLTALCMYLCFFTKNNPDQFDFSNGFLIGASVLSIATLPVFFLQRHIRWLGIFGPVRSQMIVRVCSTFSLITALFLLTRALSGSGFPTWIVAILYSTLWSAFALCFISVLEYSKKYEAGYWYQTR